MLNGTGNSYSYATQPHAAPQQTRKKTPFREDEAPSNLMYDPRVVRGSTYSANLATQTKPEKTKTVFSKSRTINNKRASTPPPVEGRFHMDVQTDDFLEELTDKAVEMDAATQTAAILDRPPSPLFIRAKIGKDMETQIENGDLFDFDLEVNPLLEVLVNKTLHVSMLELMQEEELDAIRVQQLEFEAIRNTELAEVQRYENEGRRFQKEKERRVEQEKKRIVERQQLKEKIAARSFAQQYLTTLHEGLFDTLEQQGFFFDPVTKEIEDQYVGPLMSEVVSLSNNNEAAKAMADELLIAAIKKAKEMGIAATKHRAEQAIIQEQERQAELIRLAEEAAARKIAEEAAAEETTE